MAGWLVVLGLTFPLTLPLNTSPLLNKMAARAEKRTKTFKSFFPLNQRIDFEIISQEYSLGDPLLQLPAKTLNSNSLC